MLFFLFLFLVPAAPVNEDGGEDGGLDVDEPRFVIIGVGDEPARRESRWW